MLSRQQRSVFPSLPRVEEERG